jgi:hypothetical protein
LWSPVDLAGMIAEGIERLRRFAAEAISLVARQFRR